MILCGWFHFLGYLYLPLLLVGSVLNVEERKGILGSDEWVQVWNLVICVLRKVWRLAEADISCAEGRK